MHCISCALKRKVEKPLLFKQTLKSRFTCLVCQHFSSEAKKSLDRERPFSLALRVVSLFSCLSRLAPSVTRVAICVSRVLLDGLQKKERLLVVYDMGEWFWTFGIGNQMVWETEEFRLKLFFLSFPFVSLADCLHVIVFPLTLKVKFSLWMF